MSSRLGTTLEMIKWEHSIFALPFALTGAMLAAGGLPPWRVLFWVVVCMIAARSAAMAFNRWADAEIDRVNPRTATRAIPAALLSRQFTIGFTIPMQSGSPTGRTWCWGWRWGLRLQPRGSRCEGRSIRASWC